MASVFEPENGSTDELAATEAIRIAAGLDIERDGKEKEHRRHQHFRDHVNKATIFVFWVVIVCLGFGIVVYSWHLMTPACWHFLAATAQSKLEGLLASALLSSALTGYVNRRMAD